MFDFEFCGSGGAMPLPNRALSSCLVSCYGRKILLDCGEGTQVSMRSLHAGFKDLDLICITHRHGDHIYGLPGLLATMANSLRQRPLLILSIRGMAPYLEGLLRSCHLSFDIYLLEFSGKNQERLYLKLDHEGLQIKALCDFHPDALTRIFRGQAIAGLRPLREQAYPYSTDDSRPRASIQADANLIIRGLEQEHSVPCIAFRFDFLRLPRFLAERATALEIPRRYWSKLQRGENYADIKAEEVMGELRSGFSFVFITDTRPVSANQNFAADVDLLISEATFGDD
ncbi:MAG: MBL fold metallo-hydrolase, partial [Eubacteriales bacterium]|nr:MBL fold metallo-hydrolase [Eubacteriales bacterium]